MQYTVEKSGTIYLGKQGEHRARELVLPEIAAWESEYGPGETEIIFLPPGENAPVSISPARTEDGVWLWVVTAAETAFPGYGKCELRYMTGGTVVKSATYQTYVAESLGDGTPRSGSGPNDAQQGEPAKMPLLTDEESGVSYSLIVAGGKLMIREAGSTGDKKPVVMESDRAVPGGVATLGEDGKLAEAQRPDHTIEAEATVYPSSRNLLDNWYFVGGGSQQGGGQFPINQRGETEYEGAVYGIDRWVGSFSSHQKLGLLKNGIKLFGETSAGASIIQYIENATAYSGKTVTFSCLAAETTSSCYTVSVLYRQSSGPLIYADNVVTDGSAGLKTVTVTLPNDLEVLGVSLKGFDTENGGTADDYSVFSAAKLELGPIQTLARKEGDTWVLNDPPPDYVLELAKCQRHQLVFSGTYTILGYGYSYSPLSVAVNIPTPATFRIMPSVKMIGKFVLVINNKWVEFDISKCAYEGSTIGIDSLTITIHNISSITAYHAPCLLKIETDPSAKIIFDANL